MNRVTTLLVGTFLLLSTVAVSLGTAQAAYLKVDIAAPDGAINRKTFNVEFTTLSTDADDNMDVKLYQNGSVIKSATTTKDYGDSGAFSVTVPADGAYEYYFTANSGSDTAVSSTKSVNVDTAATATPSYGGVTRNGNTYTITFTAPADGDVDQVRIYSSPSTSFTADESTQVKVVDVVPGQTYTVSYTAPDDRQRYHVIQAFDTAGNGSTLIGDANVNATQALGNGQDENAILRAGADSGVAGSETGGRVDAEGDSRDGNTNAADGLSDGSDQAKKTGANASDSWIAWAIIIVLVAGSLAYANKEKLAALYNRIRPGSNS